MTPHTLGSIGRTVAAIMIGLLTGCATVTSYHLAPDAAAKGQQAGLTYYLPMRYAEVTSAVSCSIDLVPCHNRVPRRRRYVCVAGSAA